LGQQRRRADHVDRASSRSGGTRSAREAQGRAGPRRPLRILAIETSCDETGVAIVEDGRRIRSNVVASQLVHQDTGGIVPEVAAREHLRVLDALTEKALRDAGRDLTEIDAVAATVGPGLIGCLLVGANYGRGLALAAGLPFVGVNHLEGHVYANWLYELGGGEPPPDPPPQPLIPAAVLVVSGAHTDPGLLEGHPRFPAAAEHAVETVLLGGGVAANLALREEIARRIGHPLRVPRPGLCTDNGAMIGAAAFYVLRHRGTEIQVAVRSDMKLA